MAELRIRGRIQFGLSTLLAITAITAVLATWQRERLSRWVEALRPPIEPTRDARDPQQVVTDFLRCLRQGNHAEADNLLSSKARDVMRSHPRFWTAAGVEWQHQLKDAEMISENGIEHVETVATIKSTDQLLDGDFNMRWMLRAEPEGWRITGFRLLAPAGWRGALTIDFENEKAMRKYGSSGD